MINKMAIRFIVFSLLTNSVFAGTKSLTCQNTIVIDSPLYGIIAFTLGGGVSENLEGFNGEELTIKSSNILTPPSSGGSFEHSQAVVLQVKELDTLTRGGHLEERYAVELEFKNSEVYAQPFWAVCTMGSLTGTFGF